MLEKRPAAPSLDCWFVSDLHGQPNRYEALFSRLKNAPPDALFIGGDLLPHGAALSLKSFQIAHKDFINDYLVLELSKLKDAVGDAYPRVFVILGNDDGRLEEPSVLDAAARGFWEYIHDRRVDLDGYDVYGYAYVPPTPFHLKDWEKYDVSRYVDPGCVSPEEGARTVPVTESEARYGTIQEDLRNLTGDADLSRAVFLFHSPPYQTRLDRAALDGKKIDHVPLDVHVGSIAVKRFIEERQPLLTLHGHIHESARLTGHWKETIGTTVALSAAHDGPELALVRFDPARPENAARELI